LLKALRILLVIVGTKVLSYLVTDDKHSVVSSGSRSHPALGLGPRLSFKAASLLRSARFRYIMGYLRVIQEIYSWFFFGTHARQMSLSVNHRCVRIELGLVRKLAVAGEMVRHGLTERKLIFFVLSFISYFIWSYRSFFAQVTFVDLHSFLICVANPGVAHFLLLGIAGVLLLGSFELDCY